MNRTMKIIIAAIATVLAVSVLAACQGSSSSASSGSSPGATQENRGQVLPVANNPIQNNATAPGLAITSAMVENNVDPATNKPIPDCLQIEVKNSSDQTMSNLEIYYSMTDSKTGASEGYYQKLNGLSLAPGQTSTIFFDNGTSPDHYPENKYSIYRTSQNEVRFSIELSAPGFKPAASQAVKEPGTEEQSD
jgi:hypothetical protein